MKFSIIIPIYNNFNKLEACLKSLKKQTIFNLFDVEIILVDDGSKEIEKLKNLEIDGLNFKKYFLEHKGASATRNFGYYKSAGEYIFFCDADVVFTQEKSLELFVNKLENNLDKAYCYSSLRYGWKKFRCGEFDADKLKNNNYISTMSVIRRDALEKIKDNGPWDESLKKFQDWDLWLAMLENNLTGVWLNKVLWRAKSNGVISSWLPKIFYKLCENNSKIKKYNKYKNIILKKHNLV